MTSYWLSNRASNIPPINIGGGFVRLCLSNIKSNVLDYIHSRLHLTLILSNNVRFTTLLVIQWDSCLPHLFCLPMSIPTLLNRMETSGVSMNRWSGGLL